MWAARSEKPTRPVTTVRAARPTRSSILASAPASGTGPTSRSRIRGTWTAARATARATVSICFSGVSRPKLPTTKSSAAMPRRARSAEAAPAVTVGAVMGMATRVVTASGTSLRTASAMNALCTAVTREASTARRKSGYA